MNYYLNGQRSDQKEGIMMSPDPDGYTQEQLDDYANQNNPNNDEYQENLDNHADQCNPNNDEYKGWLKGRLKTPLLTSLARFFCNKNLQRISGGFIRLIQGLFHRVGFGPGHDVFIAFDLGDAFFGGDQKHRDLFDPKGLDELFAFHGIPIGLVIDEAVFLEGFLGHEAVGAAGQDR